MSGYCLTFARAGSERRIASSLLAATFVTLAALSSSHAQEPPKIPETGPVGDFQSSRYFTLFGVSEFGRVGLRSSGTVSGHCVSNAAGMSAPRNIGCSSGPRIFNTSNGTIFSYFEFPFIIAAPPSDLPPGVDPAELLGAGYTFTTNQVLASRREELLPTDRSRQDLLNFGITATDDGTCRDFTGLINGAVVVGAQLLPNNTCKDTWPNPEGEWEGTKRLTQEAFVAGQLVIDPMGEEDPFAFWRVPEDLRTTRELGDQASFGEFADWTPELLADYGEIVPGRTGAQRIRGWPLGLTVFFDAFYFNLPTVNNATFFQYLIINHSEQVWGVPVDYDSLYWSTQRAPANGSQFQAFHVDLSRGLWAASNCTDRSANAQSTPYGGGPAGCTSGSAFQNGALGLLILKSPVGDLRNKLLSDPTSPFFNPAHPNVGDTITFNHSHGCGFITCTSVAQDFSERAAFGITASIQGDVLDGRNPSDFSEDVYFNVFNNSETWPARGDFNKYVPGDWDYNHDGEPDTIFIDSCGSNGCVPLWDDTVPGNWFNRVGQTAPMGMGPFSLAAGDTVGLIVAFVADKDSASFESTIQNVYEFYQTFFFGPEAAPSPLLSAASGATGVGVTGGAQDSTQVRLNWNDFARRFEDPFLLKLADDIEAAAPGTQLQKLWALNPWLVDSLRIRARDNIEAIHIFKSCDGGQTFTDDGDCLPDPVPAADASSMFNGIGWLPWSTVDADVNSVADGSVTGGLTFFYSLVPETRGATFNLLQDQGGDLPLDTLGNPFCDPTRCIGGPFTLAPSILSPLQRTAGAPGVASVYVPISGQAGRVPATFSVTSVLGEALVPVEVDLTADVRDGSYEALFAETLFVTTVTRARDVGGGRFDTLSVVSSAVRSGAEADTFRLQTVRSPITLRSEELVSTTTEVDPGDATVTVTTREYEVVGDGQDVAMLLLEEQGPIMATGVLERDRTTPGAFLDREDFPGYFIDVVGSEGGDFDRQTYTFTDAAGRIDSIPSAVTAAQAIEWLTGEATSLADVFGHYQISWSDKPYGPGEEFPVDVNLQARVTESVEARAVASTSVTGDELLTAVNTALDDAGLDPVATLEAYDLPFTVRNLTDGVDVSVAVINHNETVLLGLAPDTARVDIPAGKWVPGDQLVLLEPDGDGGLVPTWAAMLGCAAVIRSTCDASNQSAYASVVTNGIVQNVIYFRPLSFETQFSLAVTAPTADPTRSARDLRDIRVVPNPYVVFSQYERQQNDRILKFTNLPDSGRLRIYTVSGQFVQEITWEPDDLIGEAGDLNWDMRTRENTDIAYGLYIWVVDSPAGRARGKFVVIR